jgi:ferritin-like protein
MGHEAWHEPYESLTQETRDMHRALISLMEELEAVDWYQQRADVTPDGELKAVIEHNRDEEIEHAMMTLEWIRRRNAKFDANMRTYLFAEGPITQIEEESEEATGGRGASALASAGPSRPSGDSSLGIGSLNPGAGK